MGAVHLAIAGLVVVSVALFYLNTRGGPYAPKRWLRRLEKLDGHRYRSDVTLYGHKHLKNYSVEADWGTRNKARLVSLRVDRVPPPGRLLFTLTVRRDEGISEQVFTRNEFEKLCDQFRTLGVERILGKKKTGKMTEPSRSNERAR